MVILTRQTQDGAIPSVQTSKVQTRSGAGARDGSTVPAVSPIRTSTVRSTVPGIAGSIQVGTVGYVAELNTSVTHSNYKMLLLD